MEYYVRAEKMSYRYVQQHGQISNVGIQEARGRYPEYGCMDINVRDWELQMGGQEKTVVWGYPQNRRNAGNRGCLGHRHCPDVSHCRLYRAGKMAQWARELATKMNPQRRERTSSSSSRAVLGAPTLLKRNTKMNLQRRARTSSSSSRAVAGAPTLLKRK